MRQGDWKKKDTRAVGIEPTTNGCLYRTAEVPCNSPLLSVGEL
jgi:hypothetical protein